ncbi:MAG: hypothetical protein FD177_1194 [Desulfovibrionaceae bacterium]|nr:MAG: hypothetical protein FD177_1194 [Desulfovibrionaceae bacterium]
MLAMQDRYGLEGIGAFWVLLEVLASGVEGGKTAQVTMSVKQWRKRIPFAPQKLRNWLAYADQLALIRAAFDGETISIECPKMLELCDNWTRRSVVTVKKVPLEVEEEVDVEVEEEKDLIQLPSPQESRGVSERHTASPSPPPDPWVKAETGERYSYLFRCLDGYQGILESDVRKWEASHPLINVREFLEYQQHASETRPWLEKKRAFFILSNWLVKHRNKVMPQIMEKSPDVKAKPQLSVFQQMY